MSLTTQPTEAGIWDRYYETAPSLQPELNVVRFFRALRYGGEFLAEHGLEQWRGTPPVILDFGCGAGRHTNALAAERWGEIHGCDISATAVAQAMRPDVHATTITDYLPYPDGRFDVVLAHGVLDHIPLSEHSLWLGEIRRVLKPGGLFYASLLTQSHHATAAGELLLTTGGEAGLTQVTYNLQTMLGELEPAFRVRAAEYENRGICYPPKSMRCIEHRLWAIAERV